MSAESLTIEVRCATNGRVMRVGFGRISPEYAFEIEAILPGSGVSASIGGARLPSGRGKTPTDTVYIDNTARRHEAWEFDWSLFDCIHCDGRTTMDAIIECGACETLICTGTLRERRGGRFSYACAVCGAKSSGRRSGSIETFKARPGSAAPPALGEGRGRLLGQARRLPPGGKDDR